MDYRILGTLEIVDGDRKLELGAAKQRALLAVLLLRANEIVSLDRIIDELWGVHAPTTAPHTVQVYISQLRKVLDSGRGDDRKESVIVTRRPGYAINVERDELDLHRFEGRVERGKQALAEGDAETAARELRAALDLWRGPPLADFEFEAFAQTAIARLEELRLGALEERFQAELSLGLHDSVIAELMTLSQEHPLRERPREMLMLALYRSGRQTEALQIYTQTRETLVEELGIDPSAALQQLEQAILRQDEELAWTPLEARSGKPTQTQAPARSILLVPHNEAELELLLALSEPLARSASPHELILARLVPEAGAAELPLVAAGLEDRRAALRARGVNSRAVAFTSGDWAGDVLRLAAQQHVDLLLLAGAAEVTDELHRIFEDAPCDVAVLANDRFSEREGPVLVPFGGGEHDWSALELGAWLASARGEALTLLGTAVSEETGKRDASRLLASAALAVQQLSRVSTEPLLVAPGERAVIEAADACSVLVLGLSERWHEEGIGEVRGAITRGAQAPVVLVRRGPRPGGLTPDEGLTRFTWSLRGAGAVDSDGTHISASN
jgi:DNA-binding SARP family transcriptional activator